MGHEQDSIGHNTEIRQLTPKMKGSNPDDFVLEKTIFNNVFEKDIRRVFIYKKTERLAKAVHLITPAFTESLSLKNRLDEIAIGLVDAAIAPSSAARAALSRELLALSSVLSIARTSGFLSAMNTEIIAREAHILLQEVASYEEPRLALESTPTLSDLVRSASAHETRQHADIQQEKSIAKKPSSDAKIHKGQLKDMENIKDRREAILSVIKNKKKASIKDISTLIRNVSEKTIQRELAALIETGMVLKEGERRWSVYSVA